MPFPSTLSAGNLTSIRRTSYRANQYICLCPNTVIFQALVNGTPTGDSFAEVTFDGVTVGAYTDIVIGQTVYISPTTSINDAIFIGRVRKTPTSTILYINETSGAIADNYTIFVINDFRLWEKLARVVGSTYYKDWDLTYTSPAPIISGVQSAYAGIVSGSPTGYTIAFSASAVTVTSGATISSYAWGIGDGTATAGSVSTATVTVRFPAGFRWISLTVTDSGGRSTILRIPVWAVPADLSSQVTLGFEGAEITADLDGGFNASIPAFTGISSVLDNTLCCIFDVEYYGTTAESIVTNTKFVGRLRTESDDNQPDDIANRVQATRFEVEGVGAQLARTAAPLIKMINDSSPTVWDEINNLTFWRAICHVLQTHSTFLTINSLSFDSTSNTFLYPSFPTRGDSLWDVLKDLLESINAVAEFATSGEMRINRDARYLSSTERDALVTVATFEMLDLLALVIDHNHIDDVGQIKAYGGTFNGGTNKETVVASYWPGSAQGSGQGREVLNRQVLSANLTKAGAQTELNRRIGYKGAVSNTRDTLSIEFPDGYNFIIPSVYTWYVFLITSTDDLRGLAFDTNTRWLCESITVSHDNASGAKTVSAEFVKETDSVNGKTYNPPAPGTITPYLPGIPPINTFPAFPDLGITLPEDGGGFPFPNLTPNLNATASTDGNVVAHWTDNSLAITTNFLASTTPDWNDITPSADETVIDFGFLPGTNTAYCLTQGSGSAWSIEFYSGDGDIPGRTLAWFFTTLSCSPTYDSINDRIDGCTPAANTSVGYNLTYTASPTFNLTEVIMTNAWARTRLVGNPAFVDTVARIRINGVDRTTATNYASSSGTSTISWTGSLTCSSFELGGACRNNSGGDGSYMRLTYVKLSGTGANPFTSAGGGSTIWVTSNVFDSAPTWSQGASAGDDYDLMSIASTSGAVYVYAPSGAESRYSTDDGATWATAETVGTTPGAYGGFDTIRIGTTVLAAADGQVMIATTGGGTYSVYGSAMPAGAQPSAIVMPRYQFGSTSSGNVSTSTPQFLVASEDLTAGNAGLWKVTASGATYTDITPTTGGQFGKANGARCITMPLKSGAIILFVGTFGANRKLAVSVNSGTAWAFSANLNTDASMIVIRRGDINNRQCWIANGTSGVGYCANYRAATPTISNRAIPTTDTVIGVAVYG